jgi:hypothetical protein
VPGGGNFGLFPRLEAPTSVSSLLGTAELISTWESWWAVVLCTAGGLLAGVLLAGLALEDTLKVTITNNDIEFRKNQKTTRVPRNQVAVAARTPGRARQTRLRRTGQGQPPVLAACGRAP